VTPQRGVTTTRGRICRFGSQFGQFAEGAAPDVGHLRMGGVRSAHCYNQVKRTGFWSFFPFPLVTYERQY
jgi:hypothetical protein